MALYIPHSIFHLAPLLYVRPETFGPYYVPQVCKIYQHELRVNTAENDYDSLGSNDSITNIMKK